jgi:hypothetical protein
MDMNKWLQLPSEGGKHRNLPDNKQLTTDH